MKVTTFGCLWLNRDLATEPIWMKFGTNIGWRYSLLSYLITFKPEKIQEPEITTNTWAARLKCLI